MHPGNFEFNDHDFYFGILNDDGTVTELKKPVRIETELNYHPEPNNLLGRILLIIIAIPFMFKATK